MSLQVSITGEPGCGKTTVARLVCEQLEADYTSTGSIQRELAAKMGMTTLELNKLSESDPSIDHQIDSHTQALGDSKKTVLVDSRLAWRFLPKSLKVFLVCPPSIAASRVFDQNRANESYASKEEAIGALIARYESEKARFAKYYGAHLANLRNYDLIIDTSYAKPPEIADLVCQAARTHSERVKQLALASTRGEVEVFRPNLMISPKSLLPTQSVADLLVTEPVARSHIDIVRMGEAWAVVHGHRQVLAQIKAGQHLTSCRLLAQDDESIQPGLTVRSLLTQRVLPESISAWEQRAGFSYPGLPKFLAVRT